MLQRIIGVLVAALLAAGLLGVLGALFALFVLGHDHRIGLAILMYAVYLAGFSAVIGATGAVIARIPLAMLIGMLLGGATALSMLGHLGHLGTPPPPSSLESYLPLLLAGLVPAGVVAGALGAAIGRLGGGPGVAPPFRDPRRTRAANRLVLGAFGVGGPLALGLCFAIEELALVAPLAAAAACVRHEPRRGGLVGAVVGISCSWLVHASQMLQTGMDDSGGGSGSWHVHPLNTGVDPWQAPLAIMSVLGQGVVLGAAAGVLGGALARADARTGLLRGGMTGLTAGLLVVVVALMPAAFGTWHWPGALLAGVAAGTVVGTVWDGGDAHAGFRRGAVLGFFASVLILWVTLNGRGGEYSPGVPLLFMGVEALVGAVAGGLGGVVGRRLDRRDAAVPAIASGTAGP